MLHLLIIYKYPQNTHFQRKHLELYRFSKLILIVLGKSVLVFGSNNVSILLIS